MTLTDRYVAATLRRIPAEQHGDIEDELRASIADAVDAQVESGSDPESAETAVLTDLGDPDRLAAGLAGRPLQLIGPGLYLTWWRLLTTLLWVAPIPGAIVLTVGLLDGDPVGTAIWSGIWTAASVALQIAFWTTLVFAILERTGHGRTDDFTGPWTVDRLPDVRERRDVSLADTVASVGLLALVVAALFLQRSVSWFHTADGAAIPVLDPGLWPGWVALFLGVVAVDAVIAIVTYARGRWTVGLATLNTVSAVVFAVPTVWLATNDRLVNPAFLEASGGDSLTWLTPVIVASVVVICGWDVLDGWVKALRARRA
ncbi:permease prefix domain 1-containing protein [Cellulosimicrobium sp. Marseille-Q4280]|uniref:permease prefix domain 1-containing protein n=1 Tax=Cellulosimicrobium sp. Marseille-Q4280 TaxID=2937992 RepID=UPI0020413E74|nr:permease prefix domain 1-containing protein [Cellulosimicrobium sp. Marseille-Q4280]